MTADRFDIREAVAAEVPALAQLHVETFIETHGGPGPTDQVREWQWREAFAQTDPNWFCYVITRGDGSLIGSAKGIPYSAEISDFAGELNKIYFLREYHRRGLGRRLIGHVARRFLSQGIGSMLLFGEARNPSNGFYEALGAERLLTAAGEFHGGYGWRDLSALAKRCPTERGSAYHRSGQVGFRCSGRITRYPDIGLESLDWAV
jgi:ribosomal protein S18 acetylase RimI-like enzyme